MSSKVRTFNKVPGVCSFQRGLALSDGLFFNLIGDKEEPLRVVRHGIRGTQNVAGNKSKKGNTQTSQVRSVSNIQITDTAKLSPETGTLLVRFDIKYFDLEQSLWACARGKNDSDEDTAEFKTSVIEFAKRAKQADGVVEIANRLARNILNGRWLWRNRILTESVTVTVYCDGIELCKVDACSIPLNHFNSYFETERKLGALIASSLRAERNSKITVQAELDIGLGNVEVFPSQNYIEKKPKGFARSLYYVNPTSRCSHSDHEGMELKGQAALRDQKISNAIRTIDTWYDEHATFPIPIEPNGASLDEQKFFRSGKLSAFKIMGRLNEVDVESHEGLFMTAIFVRGGVYGEGSDDS